MPSVSRAQQKAMHAAAAGNSTIGIPQSVGEDFSAADHARGPAKLPARKSSFATAMKSHGYSKGEHKRHPATSHTSAFGSEGNKYRKTK
jgi:hypothetical protein